MQAQPGLDAFLDRSGHAQSALGGVVVFERVEAQRGVAAIALGELPGRVDRDLRQRIVIAGSRTIHAERAWSEEQIRPQVTVCDRR